MRRIRSLSRIFKTGLCGVFFLSHVLLGHATETNFWKQRQNQLAQLPVSLRTLETQPLLKTPSNHQPHTSALQKDLDPVLSDVVSSLPAQYGTISPIKKHTTPKRKGIVIHVQDVHMNSEAQQQIANSIRTLIDQKKIDAIGLEGAFGEIDLSSIRSFDYPSSVKRVADYLLRIHKISGAVHTALTHSNDIPSVHGVDDKEAYDKNVEAYRLSVLLQNDFQQKMKEEIRTLKNKKNRVFNTSLKEFDALISSYRENTVSMGQFLRHLSSYPGESPESVQIFLRALSLEEKLDFNQVSIQRTRFLKRMVNQLNERQLTGLLSASVAYRTGQLSHRDFYGHINSLAKEAKMSLTSYPHFQNYIDYVFLSDSIKPDLLFADIRHRESDVFSQLARSPLEKELIAQSRSFYLVNQLLSFSLTKEEWEEYGTRRSSLDLDLSSFEDFYRQAEIRDREISSNFRRALDHNKANVSLLVTGGFHSKGIADRLTQAGFTVVPFTPTLTKLDGDGSAYLSVFTREKTPLDKVFAGEKLFLPPEVMVHPAALTRAMTVDAIHVRDMSFDGPVDRNSDNRTTEVDFGNERWRAHYDETPNGELSLAALTFPSDILEDAKEEVDETEVRYKAPIRESWWVLWRASIGIIASGILAGALISGELLTAGSLGVFLLQFLISSLFVVGLWEWFVRKHYKKVIRYPTAAEKEKLSERGEWGKKYGSRDVLRKLDARPIDRRAVRFASFWFVLLPQLGLITWTSFMSFFSLEPFIAITTVVVLVVFIISLAVHQMFTRHHLKKNKNLGAPIFPDLLANAEKGGTFLTFLALIALAFVMIFLFLANTELGRKDRLRRRFLNKKLLIGTMKPGREELGAKDDFEEVKALISGRAETAIKQKRIPYFDASNESRMALNQVHQNDPYKMLATGVVTDFVEAKQAFINGARVFFVDKEHDPHFVDNLRELAHQSKQPVLIFLSLRIEDLKSDNIEIAGESAKEAGFDGIEFQGKSQDFLGNGKKIVALRKLKRTSGLILGISTQLEKNESRPLENLFPEENHSLLDFVRVEAHMSVDVETVIRHARWVTVKPRFSLLSFGEIYERWIAPIPESIVFGFITSGIPTIVLFLAFDWFDVFIALGPAVQPLLFLMIAIIQVFWGLAAVAPFLRYIHIKWSQRNVGSFFTSANHWGVIGSFMAGVFGLIIQSYSSNTYSVLAFVVLINIGFILGHAVYHLGYNNSNESVKRGSLFGGVHGGPPPSVPANYYLAVQQRNQPNDAPGFEPHLFWEEHKEKSREMILRGAAKVEDKSAVTVLGVGEAHDIPLIELVHLFERVNLVDADRHILDLAIQSIPVDAQDAEGRFLRDKISLIQTDITSGEMVRIYKEGLQLLQRDGLTRNLALMQLAELFESFNPAVDLEKLGLEPVPYVISSVVMTQPLAPVSTNLRNLAAQLPQGVILLAGQRDMGVEEVSDRIKRRIREQHVATLAALATEQVYVSATMQERPHLDKAPRQQALAVYQSMRNFVSEDQDWRNGIPPAILDQIDQSDLGRLLQVLHNLMIAGALSVDKGIEVINVFLGIAEHFTPDATEVMIPEGIQRHLNPHFEIEEDGQWVWLSQPRNFMGFDVEGYLLSPKHRGQGGPPLEDNATRESDGASTLAEKVVGHVTTTLQGKPDDRALRDLNAALWAVTREQNGSSFDWVQFRDEVIRKLSQLDRPDLADLFLESVPQINLDILWYMAFPEASLRTFVVDETNDTETDTLIRKLKTHPVRENETRVVVARTEQMAQRLTRELQGTNVQVIWDKAGVVYSEQALISTNGLENVLRDGIKGFDAMTHIEIFTGEGLGFSDEFISPQSRLFRAIFFVFDQHMKTARKMGAGHIMTRVWASVAARQSA